MGAGQDGGTRDPHAEGAVRAPASFRKPGTRSVRDRRLDFLLQRQTAASGTEDDDPGRGPCRYINQMT